MEFKKHFSIAMENSNWSTVLKSTAELTRVRKWKAIFEKIISTKSSKQRVEGGGRKFFDSDLEHKLVAWV